MARLRFLQRVGDIFSVAQLWRPRCVWYEFTYGQQNIFKRRIPKLCLWLARGTTQGPHCRAALDTRRCWEYWSRIKAIFSPLIPMFLQYLSAVLRRDALAVMMVCGGSVFWICFLFDFLRTKLTPVQRGTLGEGGCGRRAMRST